LTEATAAYRFRVNGEPVELAVPGMRRLLDALREDLGLTGTKEGCGEGECGACSVILDGAVVDSCLVPVCQVEGADIHTVEGLGDLEHLSPLQQAFLETGGAQCGICTPGMLMAAGAYLDAGGAAVDESIREAIAGNLCRCTGYTKIIEAIALAAERRIASVYGTLTLPRAVDELIEEMRGPAIFPTDAMDAGDP
jgi:carbon-monoxide dehydrogenase small subunit